MKVFVNLKDAERAQQKADNLINNTKNTAKTEQTREGLGIT